MSLQSLAPTDCSSCRMASTKVLVQKHIFSGREIRIQPLRLRQRPQMLPAASQLSASGQGGSVYQAERNLTGQVSKRQDTALLEVTGEPENGNMASSHSLLLVAGFSTLLTAGAAAAHGDGTEIMYMQQTMTQTATQPTDILILADFSLLPSFSSTPFQILGFLLNHPLITLGLALGVNYIVPRAFRAAVRFLVVPLVIGSVAWVALQNPSAAWGLFRGVFDCELPNSSMC